MGMDDRPRGPGGSDEDSIMAAVDEAGNTSRLVIADVNCDGAWVSVSAQQAAPLAEWV